MDWTAGKPPIFVLFMYSASRSRKRKEKKMQNGNSKVEIEMEKGLPSECLNFQFMKHTTYNAKLYKLIDKKVKVK